MTPASHFLFRSLALSTFIAASIAAPGCSEGDTSSHDPSPLKDSGTTDSGQTDSGISDSAFTDQSSDSASSDSAVDSSSDTGSNSDTGSDTATDADHTPPSIVSTNPVDGAVDVPLNLPIEIKFSEKLDLSTVNENAFELIEWWEGNPQGTARTGTIDSSANPIIRFTPTIPYDKGDEYRFTIKAGVKDLLGNAMTDETNVIFDAAWLSPADAPSVVSITPTKAATNVPTNASLAITFNRTMRQASVDSPKSVKLFPTANPTAFVTLTRQYFANPTFMFYPTVALAANTPYTIVVSGGASGVQDDANNGMYADYTSDFTTGSSPDTTPLHVSTIVPADNATGASSITPVTITFDKPIDPSSATLSTTSTPGTILVSRYADYSFPEAGTLDLSKNPVLEFRIDTATTYELNRKYYVKVQSGAKGVLSLTKTQLAAPFTSSFTVKGPDKLDGTIQDLRNTTGFCSIRVPGVYMTYYRDQPNHHKGFFVQKDKTGPAIFVQTGDYKPSALVPPDPSATGYQKVDLYVTKVEDYQGFKQVTAYSMVVVKNESVDLSYLKNNIVQTITTETINADFESEYIQIDGQLANYRPGASAENREYDLLYGTKKITIKVNQFDILEPLALQNGTRVRVLAPVHKDDAGFFLKAYRASTADDMTAADLAIPANFPLMLDIVRLAN